MDVVKVIAPGWVHRSPSFDKASLLEYNTIVNEKGFAVNCVTPTYNAIIVAAARDNDDTDRSNDSIDSDSSRGPTPLGRKKPDLTAPGVGIVSTDVGGGWDIGSGTSYAAPHVAGALILAWDYGIWDPALLKAWLINSAEDRGAPGWDVEWGWGYIDLDAAYDQIDYTLVGSVSAYDKWYSGTMNAGEKVTIAWKKHSGYPLTDLDLYLYDSNGNLLDSSEFTRDNVEQVKLDSGSNVSVYIRVHCWSCSLPNQTQTFGLAAGSPLQPVSAPWWWGGSTPAKTSLADRKKPRSEGKIFALYNNYPNPCNPETWIPYQLAADAHVVIHIYNAKGQLVRTLDLGNQRAGAHITKDKAAYWDGKNDEGSFVASGVYFYTLEVNGKEIGTRKMIMSK